MRYWNKLELGEKLSVITIAGSLILFGYPKYVSFLDSFLGEPPTFYMRAFMHLLISVTSVFTAAMLFRTIHEIYKKCKHLMRS